MRESPRAALPYLIAFGLAAVVLAVYWQVGNHAFIDLDDREYVLTNSQVLRGLTWESVSWAFTTFHAGNWHPVTWLSHMIDVDLFGPSPGWHHRMNMLYHLLNTELLFLVLWRMTGGLWQSAFVSILFGVHPLHVESVAWVAERKDVLSTLFWILIMGAYLRYRRRPSVGRYIVVVVTFALGLMSKPMLVTLPITLLLFDYWPLQRIAGVSPDWDRADLPGQPPRASMQRLLIEKAPLLALSLASCVVTYVAQGTAGAINRTDVLLPEVRVINAVVSYVVYVARTAWPSGLAVFYPHPGPLRPFWMAGASSLFLIGATYIVVRHGRRRPYLPVGWLFFLGTLVPVIGLVQVGEQAMADRYTYVPLIGIFIAIAWGVPSLVLKGRFRTFALGVSGAIVVVALSVATWVQLGYWRDNVTLFQRAVAVTERNWLALSILGASYAELGRFQQAIDCNRESLKIKPNYASTWNNLGVTYGRLGQFRQAIDCFTEALRIDPDCADARRNLIAVNRKTL